MRMLKLNANYKFKKQIKITRLFVKKGLLYLTRSAKVFQINLVIISNSAKKELRQKKRAERKLKRQQKRAQKAALKAKQDQY
jgi:hypothetical protein